MNQPYTVLLRTHKHTPTHPHTHTLIRAGVCHEITRVCACNICTVWHICAPCNGRCTCHRHHQLIRLSARRMTTAAAATAAAEVAVVVVAARKRALAVGRRRAASWSTSLVPLNDTYRLLTMTRACFTTHASLEHHALPTAVCFVCCFCARPQWFSF